MIRKALVSVVLIAVSLTTMAQAKSAVAGHYYDYDGNKKEGMFVFKLKYLQTYNRYLLVEYQDGKKVNTFTRRDVQSFVLGTDSMVATNYGKSVSSEGAFAIVEDTGRIKLHVIPSSYEPGKAYKSDDRWMTLKGSNRMHLIATGNGSQELLIEWISDYTELAEEVKAMKGKAYWKSAPSLIARYNAWYDKQQLLK